MPQSDNISKQNYSSSPAPYIQLILKPTHNYSRNMSLNCNNTPGTEQHRIVIIGGGYAGLSCASALSKFNAEKGDLKFNITLFEKNNFIESTPFALRVMAKPDEFDHNHAEFQSFENQLNRNGHTVTLMSHTEVVSLDRSRRVVKFRIQGNETVQELSYDYLVIASGSQYKAPYIKPNTSIYSTPEHRRLDFQQFQNQIGSPEHTHAVVIGGGALGVELVGELVDLSKARSVPFKITIVHSKPMFRERTNSVANHQYIENFMKQNDVQVLLNYRADLNGHDFSDDVNPSVKKRLVLNPSSYDSESSSKPVVLDDVTMIFWCSSLKPATIWLKDTGIELDEYSGAVKVNSSLQSVSDATIFAIGDVNSIPGEKLAGIACKHGKVAAKNIALTILQCPEEELAQCQPKPFSKSKLSLGLNDGVHAHGDTLLKFGSSATKKKSKILKFVADL